MTQTTTPVLFPPFLLATDGSPSAQVAQKLLAAIAQTLQAQQNGNGRSLVTVLTVEPRRSSRSKRLPTKQAPVASQATESTPVAPAADASSEMLVELTALPSSDELATTLRPHFPVDVPIAVQVKQGRPAIEILRCARTIQAGLIGVGSRGPSSRLGRLMGSVSVIIARYAPCSVLVARGAASTAEPSLHHLLLVVNDSSTTQQAIATAYQLLPAGVQQITILYAQPPLNADYLFGPFATPTPSWQLNQSLQEAQREQSEQVLAHAKDALNRPGVTVHTLRQTGDPGPLICQIAQQRQADLIVLGGNATRRWLRFPAGEALLTLQSFRRSKPDEPKPDSLKPEDKLLVKPPPALRNTRLSATEDYTLHHAPCPVLLCRTTAVAAN
ncbi:universal stress protein [Leptolyngbya sp. FACHB-321]|uniref:universal stress protein n=1 Tax=Leptolyngbya sp. FACHB-321 TaxID=2692807 RepID=UPI0016851C31|nr:universal stress protein [Leptolyngbya sp. FACHB-321]MBD2037184.1 universal stress protein [Leptolyngbya sp. FACHB-321]